MPRSRGPRTAAEVVRELESDPAWRAQRAAREAAHAALATRDAAEEADLVADLRAAGFRVASVWDFVNSRPIPDMGHTSTVSADYAEAYPVLIRHLQSSPHRGVREGIARALTVRDAGEGVERALRASFAAESDAAQRWVLANALLAVIGMRRFKADAALVAAYSSSGRVAPEKGTT